MARFAIGEYIRNIGYNIVSILLLAVTFIACTIFLSNISAQRRMMVFLSPYLNENSIIIGRLGHDFDVTELMLYDTSIMTREAFCFSDDLVDATTCLVYNEYSMDNLTPRLLEGNLIKKTDSEDEIMQVLVSENSSDIGVGDIIEVSFFSEEGAMEGEMISMPARVTGVIASGQKLLFGNGVNISKTMESSDIFGTYSYEQLGYALIVTTEDEFAKLPKKVVEENYRCIVKFDEKITNAERNENYQKVMKYEREYGLTGTSAFPETSRLVDMQKEEMQDLIIKYIPLTVAVFVLVAVCIICMVSIKNANSMHYYATLYICGMPYEKAVIMSGMEMFVNNFLAIVIAVTFVLIQNKRPVIGEINCELGSIQVCVMIIISIVIVLWSMLTTRNTLKERSPMNVLKDTAY